MRNAATGWSRSLVVGVSGLWVVALLALGAAPAAAAVTALTVTTTYPTVQVDPGGQVELPIRVESPTPQRVDLSVNNLPDGFKATFRGGGFIVSSVYTSGNDASPAPTDLKLRVEVPDTATPQDYSLTVHAAAGSATADLPITLKVATVEGGGVTLTTTVQRKTGTIGSPVSFSVTLNNDSAADLDFSVTVPDAPGGWNVTATPSNEADPNNFTVAGGDTDTITVSAEPPAGVSAGDYLFTLVATAGDQVADVQLGVRLTGSEELALRSTVLNAHANAGSATNYSFTVVNTGSAPITNITLSDSSPDKWTVTFSQPTIPSLEPGTEVAITAAITPVSDAVAGDYVVTVSADAGSASDSIDVRTTVETSTLWGYIGIALIALVVIGLLLVFRRYGRR
ncbi:MAG: hypothetical protein QOH61_2165 [Chloroflexota bacterium]|jgi:uncharacterized repeat protein (TIGR01451 family)|nr:hypothetical protein [Chloroflexota bacterium]